MSDAAITPRGQDVLVKYWSIFQGDDEAIEDVVAAVFTSDAVFSSATLARPLRGHGEIAHHLRRIRAAIEGATTRHLTEVQWVHDTARWCWRSTIDDATHRGMDIVQLAPDGDRIELLVVFAGLLPAPA